MPQANRPTSKRRRARIRRYRRTLIHLDAVQPPLRERGESLDHYEDRLFQACARAVIESAHDA